MSEVIAKVTAIDNGRIEGELIGKLVRCKDCIHGTDSDEGYIVCEFDACGYPVDWFCADGEQKEVSE